VNPCCCIVSAIAINDLSGPVIVAVAVFACALLPAADSRCRDGRVVFAIDFLLHHLLLTIIATIPVVAAFVLSAANHHTVVNAPPTPRPPAT
jgi:hypothetical protein